MRIALLLLCLSACFSIGFGQANKAEPVRADLTGTWEFDAARSNVGKSRNSSPEQIKITHHDPELIIRRKVTVNGVTEVRDLTYYTDGRGETNPATAWVTANPGSETWRPRETISKTKWNKDKVVTRSVDRAFAGGAVFEVDIIDEWRLSTDGKSLNHTTRTVPRQGLSGNAAFVVGSGVEFKAVYKRISN